MSGTQPAHFGEPAKLSPVQLSNGSHVEGLSSPIIAVEIKSQSQAAPVEGAPGRAQMQSDDLAEAHVVLTRFENNRDGSYEIYVGIAKPVILVLVCPQQQYQPTIWRIGAHPDAVIRNVIVYHDKRSAAVQGSRPWWISVNAFKNVGLNSVSQSKSRSESTILLDKPEEWQTDFVRRFGGRKPVTIQELQEDKAYDQYGIVVNGKNTGVVQPAAYSLKGLSLPASIELSVVVHSGPKPVNIHPLSNDSALLLISQEPVTWMIDDRKGAVMQPACVISMCKTAGGHRYNILQKDQDRLPRWVHLTQQETGCETFGSWKPIEQELVAQEDVASLSRGVNSEWPCAVWQVTGRKLTLCAFSTGKSHLFWPERGLSYEELTKQKGPRNGEVKREASRDLGESLLTVSAKERAEGRPQQYERALQVEWKQLAIPLKLLCVAFLLFSIVTAPLLAANYKEKCGNIGKGVPILLAAAQLVFWVIPALILILESLVPNLAMALAAMTMAPFLLALPWSFVIVALVFLILPPVALYVYVQADQCPTTVRNSAIALTVVQILQVIFFLGYGGYLFLKRRKEAAARAQARAHAREQIQAQAQV